MLDHRYAASQAYLGLILPHTLGDPARDREGRALTPLANPSPAAPPPRQLPFPGPGRRVPATYRVLLIKVCSYIVHVLMLHVAARDLFARYHGALSGDITALKYSLQMSILNRPLPPEDLPTSRHAHLSERIKSVKEAMILPIQNEAYDPAASPETPVEDFNSHTYEDILATAILNKVLESCEGERPDEVTIEVSHEVTSTDTDSGMSGGAKESRRGRLKRGELSEGGSEGSEERSLTPPRRSSRRPPTVSPDQGVVTDDSWAQAAAGDGPPLQFKVSVSDSGGSWRGSRCSLDDTRERRRREKVTRTATVAEDALLPSLNIPLPDPSHLASRRVSFPELGADIVHDSCSDTDCCQVNRRHGDGQRHLGGELALQAPATGAWRRRRREHCGHS
ncbi:hypothetical protein C7M84_003026 [Penaeus vannamei]|uniref:Uncharacterized protein n=1 Tax=Penaeus vannamei TaxID=6689 RepID=A0A423TP91_PENVA|nr:hypothetical protein C7M84_003026 [Penaeus vannamei]